MTTIVPPDQATAALRRGAPPSTKPSATGECLYSSRHPVPAVETDTQPRVRRAVKGTGLPPLLVERPFATYRCWVDRPGVERRPGRRRENRWWQWSAPSSRPVVGAAADNG